MSLSELSAQQLAKLDAVCLKYESDLRRGKEPAIEDVISNSGVDHVELLRKELEAIAQEVQREQSGTRFKQPFSTPNSLTPEATPSPETGPAPKISASRETPPSGEAGLSPETIEVDNNQVYERPSAASPTLPDIGTMVGPYKLVGELGHGGMGIVFDAMDTRLQRRVAIKMLSTDMLSTVASKRQAMTERFEREAKAVAALSHPNIVELFDVGVFREIPFAVMEYLQGETLDQRLKRYPLTTTEVRLMGTVIAKALTVAHQNNVVHRDLKPQNIMLVSNDDQIDLGTTSSKNLADVRIKVFDFGLSRMPQDDSTMDQTKDGVILGTPGYMSPEQARGESATEATDIFSLGCILYEAFFGCRAIKGVTTADRLASTLKDSPEFDPLRRRDDAELADLIRDCLLKVPGDRPSAEKVAAVLSDHRVSDAIRDTVEAGYESGLKTRRRFLTSLSGGVVGALVGSLYSSAGAKFEIDSIAVLPLKDLTDVAEETPEMNGQPLGLRSIDRGQRLAVLLINELSRMNDVEVRPYRPIQATTPDEFERLGEELQVDAILTGNITGTIREQFVNMELVSTTPEYGAAIGDVIWGKSFPIKLSESLLAQSGIASTVAEVVGRHLTSQGEDLDEIPAETFKCLLDGDARSDPESVTGLIKALKCYEHARDSLEVGYAKPHAGIALTAITLAGQSDREQALKYIKKARAESLKAIELDNMSFDARLAQAMLAWQTQGFYNEAKKILEELILKKPYNWQANHQYGLLLLTMGDQANGKKALRDAARLNPLSVMVKLDMARAEWFSGGAKRAKDDADRYMEKYNGHEQVRGLLIDILEQQESYREAAEAHGDFGAEPPMTRESYAAQRVKNLDTMPYGPFGPVMNRAIFNARFKRISDNALADMIEDLTPTLPFLLANHPALRFAKTMERSQELLQDNKVLP